MDDDLDIHMTGGAEGELYWSKERGFFFAERDTQQPYLFWIRYGEFEDFPEIVKTAHESWWANYPAIIGTAQIKHLLKTRYSLEALQEEYRSGNGCQYLVIQHRSIKGLGFAGVKNHQEEPNILRLERFYFPVAFKGLGAAKVLMKAVVQYLGAMRYMQEIELNVHRNNPALGFYEHFGFYKHREEVLRTGNFLLDDFVMRYRI